ncbi:uncharacterized protein LOC5501224 isoform X1 [Nematostella vectensis]|uniref:uncharacterized protein LOC5501224 isoform X1 n=1 Tax=Nematostella vectensis TaxID=45351 RepID=UPI002076E0BF|nr:uncharacterized protein LOC5501224 isoform X1 [Nematostella vectensis]
MTEQSFTLFIFFILGFTAADSYLSSSRPCQDRRFALDFPSTSGNGFASSPVEATRPLTAFTLCMRINSTNTGQISLFSLYSQDNSGKEMELVDIRRAASDITVKIGTNETTFSGAFRQSFCLTWDSDNGKVFLFPSGNSDYGVAAKGYRIQPKGTAYIGRKPAGLLRFDGSIGGVNVWDYVLPRPAIYALTTRCGAEAGNVLQWSSTSWRITGDVRISEEICPTQADLTGGVLDASAYWKLDGQNKNVSLQYSAVYLEGTSKTTNALYLDGTKAFAQIPSLQLEKTFTIACWVRHMNTYSPFRDVLISDKKSNDNSTSIILELSTDRRITLTRRKTTGEDVKWTLGNNALPRNEWHHVGVTFEASRYVMLWIDGKLLDQQNVTSSDFLPGSSQTWDIGGDQSDRYGYFHGYISNLFIFSRVVDSWPRIMAFDTFSSEFSRWLPLYPTPHSPAIQTREQTTAELGTCYETRNYTYVDCFGALLSGNHDAIITVPDPFTGIMTTMHCDHSTNGGGWTIIARWPQNTSSERPDKEYEKGFDDSVTGEYFLGLKMIAWLTQYPSQLLTTYTSSSVTTYALYDSFRLDSTSYEASSAGFSGSAQDTILSEIIGDKNKDSVFKLRPRRGIESDYSILFKRSREANDSLEVNGLVELKFFTACLWTKLRNKNTGSLFSIRDSNDFITARIGPDYSSIQIVNSKSSFDFSVDLHGDLFDDRWQHWCFTFDSQRPSPSASISLYHEGRLQQKKFYNLNPIRYGGTLSIGMHKTLDDDLRKLIGHIAHFNLWDSVLTDDVIARSARGPGLFSGNVVPWTVLRSWVSGNVPVLYPASCHLQELYHWGYSTANESQLVDKVQAKLAWIEGGRVDKRTDEWVMEDPARLVTGHVGRADSGVSVSFWMRQQALISHILGDNQVFHDLLRSWLEPHVVPWTSWKLCYSSTTDGWFMSRFHRQCDYMGPTLTLMRSGENVFGGFIHHSWGDFAELDGYLPSSSAFLFALINPYNLPPTYFPVKQPKSSQAGRWNRFLGPTFGIEDLVCQEERHGRYVCSSNVGSVYAMQENFNKVTNGSSVFTGSRWFILDEMEVFFYNDANLDSINVSLTSASSARYGYAPIQGLLAAGASPARAWCSADSNGYLEAEWGQYHTVTHVTVEGLSPGNFTKSFNISYALHNSYMSEEWNNIPDVFLTRRGGLATTHAFSPPLHAFKMRFYPITWSGAWPCMRVAIFSAHKRCGSAHGMENEKLIPDERLTASSTFQIEKLDKMHEYRWPRQGRLNNNQGAKKWVPSAMETQEWYQVDLGKENQEITCVAIQPNSNHEQYIKGFEVPYSNDGAAWEILKGYSHVKHQFKANYNNLLNSFTTFPRSVLARFLRIQSTECEKYCTLRMELYGRNIGIQQNITGLSINFRRGKYDVQYSTAKQTWQLLYPVKEGLSHVIITWSEANGLKLFLDGVLKRHSINPVNKTTISSPVNSEAKIEIKTSPRVGPGQLPVALGALKVWPAELGQEQVKGLYQSAVCDFESGLCIGSVFSPVTNSSWIRTLYCVNTNMPGNCTDGSRTGYFLMLKSSQGLHGQSSMINTTKLVSRYSCFTFQYLMLGSDVGRLNVYQIGYHGNKTFLWMMYGNQSEEWQDARIPLSSVHDFKVTLEGVSGGSYQGFIAIDNVTVTIESCKTHPPIAQPKAGVFSSSMLRHKATLRENITGMLATQGQGSRSWMPCYRLRSNGADLTTFDKLCTGKGPTVTVARTGNALLGGFTEQSWNQEIKNPDAYSLDFSASGDKYVSRAVPTRLNAITLSIWLGFLSDSLSTIVSATNLTLKCLANSIQVQKTLYLTLQIGSTEVQTSALIRESGWHHVCVMWENGVKSAAIYVDGVILAEQATADDIIIEKDSEVYFGNHNFGGKLSQINAWSFRVSGPFVALLASGCGSISHGDVLAWSSFRNSIVGDVKIISSGCEDSSAFDYEVFFSYKQGERGFISIPNITISNTFTLSWWMLVQSVQRVYVMTSVGNPGCGASPTKVYLKVWFEFDGVKRKFHLSISPPCETETQEWELEVPDKLGDLFWHHIAVTHSSGKVQLFIDGTLKGETQLALKNINATGSNIVIWQFPNDGLLNGSADAITGSGGRLSSFNMWNVQFDRESIELLATSCGEYRGNVIGWDSLQKRAVGARVLMRAGCNSDNYRPDSKAFVYYNGSAAMRVRTHYSHVATADIDYQGPVFGKFSDISIGIGGNMSRGNVQDFLSFEENAHDPGRFVFDDVEVLYQKESLCEPACPYNQQCDEVSGGCQCTLTNKPTGLCNIYSKYANATHFWPLDDTRDTVNWNGRYWDKHVDGAVYLTRGVNNHALCTNEHIYLDTHHTLCYKNSPPSCPSGYTFSIWMKTEKDGNPLNMDKFILIYLISSARFMVVCRTTGDKFVFDFSYNIWIHLVITYDKPSLLRLYKNGEELTKVDSIDKESSTLKPVDMSKGCFDDIAFWDRPLSHSQVVDLYESYTKKSGFSLSVQAVLTSETWYSDHQNPDSEAYQSLRATIQDNVQNCYSSHSGVTSQVTTISFREKDGKVMANFSIQHYGLTSYLPIAMVTDNMTTDYRLGSIPVSDARYSSPDVSVNPPSNVTVVANATFLVVSWTPPDMAEDVASIAQGYRVYCRQSPSKSHVVTLPGFVTSAQCVNLTLETTYEVTVAFYTLRGEGRMSDAVRATTSGELIAPNNFTVDHVNSTCFTVTWQTVSVAQGYRLYYEQASKLSLSEDEEQILLKCIQHDINPSATSATICKLRPHTMYIMAIRAYDWRAGPTSEPINVTTLEGVPSGYPTKISCLNATLTSLAVQWQGIPDNASNGVIRGYHLSYRLKDSINSTFSVSIAACHYVTLDGLGGSKAYVITVAGFTAAGNGSWSAPVVCWTAEEAPSSYPSNITITNVTSTTLSLQWGPVPAEYRNGLIVSYTVRYHISGNSTYKEMMIANCNQSAVIINLRMFTRYILLVRASTKVGGGPWSDVINVTTQEGAPAVSPPNVRGYNTSSTSITVTWGDIPTGELHGILRYIVVVYHRADDRTTTQEYRHPMTSYHSSRRRRRSVDSSQMLTIGNLTKYTMYTIRVGLYTLTLGPLSPAINVTTDEDVPSMPPLNLTVTNITTSSFFVSWSPLPADSANGVLLGYVLRWYEVDNSTGEAIERVYTAAYNELFYTVNGLRPYTLYLVSVAGYTQRGSGAVSQKPATTVQKAPDGPPLNVTGEPLSTHEIRITWQPVAKQQQNGLITWYHVVLYDITKSVKVREANATGSLIFVDFVGLSVKTNYTVHVRAFNSKGAGPFSEWKEVSTGKAVPNLPPANVTARATGSTSAHVQWSNLHLSLIGAIRGYRVRFTGVNHPFAATRTTAVPYSTQETNLTGLYMYTLYEITVAAFTTRDGNYSDPVYITTEQGVPSVAPGNMDISLLSPSVISIVWDPIPAGYRNGEITAYRVRYRRRGESEYVTRITAATDIKLTGLQMAEQYEIRVAAGTVKGYGNETVHMVHTGEDVPGQAPSNITAQNRTTLTTIPVSWVPVPTEHMNGVLTGYYIRYVLVRLGDETVSTQEHVGLDVPPDNTSAVLRDLRALAVYRIEVAARTRRGVGPAGVTFGETCRCKRNLTTNWRQYKPYVTTTVNGSPGLIIPVMLQEMLVQCCGSCADHGQSRLDLTVDGHNNTAQKKTIDELLNTIDGETDFSFPVHGYKGQDSYKRGLGYTPMVESPGAAFVVGQVDTTAARAAMFDKVIGTWPVIVLPLVMAYIAGAVMWFLDSKMNPGHFPQSFIHGTWEGLWWSFVSITTVGYGDRSPVSYSGRIFAVSWTLTGIIIVSLATGVLTTSLTEITLKSKSRIYGTKIGAIHNSPEYFLGLRKNGYYDEEHPYHTLDEVVAAIKSRKVDGALVDSFAGGARPDLFDTSALRVVKAFDDKTAYGVVTSGDAIQLRHCFHGYTSVNRVQIFGRIKANVQPMKGAGKPLPVQLSTGLFDSTSNLFKNTLRILAVWLVIIVMAGLAYELRRRLKSYRKVQAEMNLQDRRRKKLITEMRTRLEEFHARMTRMVDEMKSRHLAELSRAIARKKWLDGLQEKQPAGQAFDNVKIEDVSL